MRAQDSIARGRWKKRSTLLAAAAGLWVMSDYQASPRPYVPNRAASGTAPVSITAAPRRLFNSPVYWAKNLVTVTDNAATAPDGTNRATTIVAAAGNNWSLTAQGPSHAALPAGTYTLFVSILWNGTGSASIGIGNTAAGKNGVVTATGSWARYSWTFTTSSPAAANIGLFSPDNGTSAANFAIDEMILVAGTTDPYVLGGNNTNSALFVGPGCGYRQPTYSNGYLDFTSNAFGLIQFPTTRTTTAATVYVLAKCVGTSQLDQQVFLSDAQNADALRLSPARLGGEPGTVMRFNGVQVLQSAQGGNGALTDQNGAGWAILVFRYDGAAGSWFIDDLQSTTRTVSAGTASIADLNVCNDGGVNFSDYQIGAIAYFETAHTYDQVVTVENAIWNLVAANGITRAPKKFVLCVGDSIMAGQAGTTHVHQYARTTSNHYRGFDAGVSGQTISQMIALGSTHDSYLPKNLNGRRPVIFGHIGTNSFPVGGEYTGNAAGAVAALQAWGAARKAAGWGAVVVSTLLDRDDASKSASWATDKAAFRTALLAAVGSGIDAVVDYDADANLSTAGGTTAADNTTNFNADKLHPKTTGYGLMAAVAGPVIDGVGVAA